MNGKGNPVSKAAIAGLIAQIEESGAELGPNGGFARAAPVLSEVFFEVRSPGGEVAVWMSATGRLDDVLLRDGVRESLGLERLAAVVNGTIQRADDIRRQAETEWKLRLDRRKTG